MVLACCSADDLLAFQYSRDNGGVVASDVVSQAKLAFFISAPSVAVAADVSNYRVTGSASRCDESDTNALKVGVWGR